MGRASRSIVAVGPLLLLTVLAIDCVVVYTSLATIARANGMVDHTWRVISELERVLSFLKDAETGQRGYLLTGRDEYRRPFHLAESGLAPGLDRLRVLTADNAEQQARMASLGRLADEKMAELSHTLALKDAQGLDAALEIVNSDRGRHVMEEVRTLVATMEAEERELLEERTSASRSAIRGAITSFTVTTASALALMLLVSRTRWREERTKDAAAAVIRTNEAWLATTLTSIGDALIASDKQGHVRFMNPVAQALTGWTSDDAVGRPMSEVFHIVNERTRQPAENPVEKVIREGVVVGLANHTILIDRNGHETPIEDSAAPIRDEGGRIVGVVMVFRDACQQRMHEIERDQWLAAAQEARTVAEEANRSKDRFLAILSHELRTPLNPILLAVTSMLERPTEAEEIRPNLEMIRQNVNLQARLIDDLLDVMRIVRGKMPLHWEVADCHALIHQAVQICRSEVFGNTLRLSLDLAAARHHINADPARLQQVFWNLIKNAVKFTPAGGTITIRTRNARDDDNQGDRIDIEIADTGIGIDSEMLPSIFDHFQQGEATITRKFGGLGLGLAICRGIIEGHGGLITAESRGKDQGTTFRLSLRTLPEPAVPENGKPVRDNFPPSPPDPRQILLVEDELATLHLLARLLRRLGHEVTTATSITQALASVETGDFDLVISDIGLPDGNGLELMKQIVARRGAVPSIALTGYGMEEDIRRSRSAGFTAHMTKPIDFVKLEVMIQQVTAHKTPRRSERGD